MALFCLQVFPQGTGSGAVVGVLVTDFWPWNTRRHTHAHTHTSTSTRTHTCVYTCVYRHARALCAAEPGVESPGPAVEVWKRDGGWIDSPAPSGRTRPATGDLGYCSSITANHWWRCRATSHWQRLSQYDKNGTEKSMSPAISDWLWNLRRK